MNYCAFSPAKLNLSLDILGVLPNGYHELSSVVHTVSWYDVLRVDLSPGVVTSLQCNRPELSGTDNLVLRALHLWNDKVGTDLCARIHLHKGVPSGAGLGGGSGNAAAMLEVLNQHSGQTLNQTELEKLGAKLGADVPLFLRGGAMLMEGVGEKLSPLAPLSGWVVVVKPPVSLGTPQIYRNWDEGGWQTVGGTAALLQGWPLAPRELAERLSNDLERAANRTGYDYGFWCDQLRRSGALGAAMTGSGSACYGIYTDAAAASAGVDHLTAALAKDVQNVGVQVRRASFLSEGITVHRQSWQWE